jgi:rhomboid-like protein
MPLPEGERSQPEINGIFNGEDVDVDTGNYILSVMHWRRMSGALIDKGLDFPKQSGVTREQALRGLLYVRRVIPDVDEAALGAVWAEEESKRAAKEIQDRAVKLGIYKPLQEEEVNPEEEEYIEEAEEEKQGTEYGREKSGTSVFQTVREAKEARFRAEQAAKVEAELREETAAIHRTRGPLELSAGVQPTANHLVVARDNQGGAIHQPTKKAWLQPYERAEWVKKYEEAAQITKSETAPDLSTTRRLLPAFGFLLVVLAGCYYLHETYTPPPKSARLWPESPPAAATLWGLTGVLIAGFVLNRIPPLWRTYSKYLTIVPAYPWAVSILGAGFRHDTLKHLVVNLVPLWLFGLLLHEDVGRGTFLAIYLASGAIGGYASLVTNVLRKNWSSYIFGSSGAVFGVVASSCLLRPNGTVKIAGYEVPIAAWVFLAFAATGEVVSARFFPIRGVDHPGHLGGIAAGAAAAWWLSTKAKRNEARRDAVRAEE